MMDAIPDEWAYDAADDAMKSYYAAIEAKRQRGDTTYPQPAPKEAAE